ncbi:hypothetical protein BBJ28_00005355 [Nothophytophthora sp. Chile5]|nr:hypothetical protein BBJ28_00005355 [Nothophytophthora sp. Chile5]
MKERVAELMALETVADALHQDDLVDVLNEITMLSDDYLPMLAYLMQPDNVTCLVFCMLQEPTLTAKATAAATREPGEPPSYEEYATAFRAHWILCASVFSPHLLAATTALTGAPRATLVRSLIGCNARGCMTLEAFARYLTAFMGQYSPQALIALFDGDVRQQQRFLESLLLLMFYEPIRDVAVRLCNELQGVNSPFEEDTIVGLLLFQLSPSRPVEEVRALVPERLRQRMMCDAEHVQFARMIFTCDLLTDLIHERREGSLGYSLVVALSEREPAARLLIATALHDLRGLPSSFANESYALKVLNTLLQQTQCGCVAKAAYCRANAARQVQPAEDGRETEAELTAACAQGSPHEDLPLVWHVLLEKLPELLSFISPSSDPTAALRWRFNPTHVQVVYLLLPVLNVSCSVADTHVIRTEVLHTLLDLVLRFPQASILHCAIARLFIVALEDSPYMFGKELPAFRSPTDPLRLHFLLGNGFESILHAFDWATIPSQDETTGSPRDPSPHKKLLPPPVFLDVAISLDQALTSAYAHSPQLFAGNAAFERWKVFRLRVLLPTQTLWEEQFEPVVSVSSGPPPPMAAMLYGDEDSNGAGATDISSTFGEDNTAASPANLMDEVQTEVNGFTKVSTSSTDASETESHPQPGPCAAVLTPQPALAPEVSAPAVEDVPTPLSALYNDEEKRMIRNVPENSDVSSPSSPPLALVMSAAVSLAT